MQYGCRYGSVLKSGAAVLCAAGVALLVQILPQEARSRPGPELSAGAAGLPTVGGTVLVGPARIIDGDTIEVSGRRVRLEGVDAPEIRQTCRLPQGSIWPAGKIAATALERRLRGGEVTCRGVGNDGYGRILARCSVGGRDINAELVRDGLAWAFRKYSTAYLAEEATARRAAVGIWGARCETAWDYRSGHWRTAGATAPDGCAIKGNITRNGRIYHMPWSPWYARTRVEPERGERWFCDERQAIDAGWRPALVR